MSDTRLDEYDQLEWWDVARRLHPAMTWEEFERDWDEFVREFGKSSANAELTHTYCTIAGSCIKVTPIRDGSACTQRRE